MTTEENQVIERRNIRTKLVKLLNNMPFRTIEEFINYANKMDIHLFNYHIDDRLTQDYKQIGKVITVFFDLYNDTGFKACISAKGFDALENIHVGYWTESTHGYVSFNGIDWPYLIDNTKNIKVKLDNDLTIKTINRDLYKSNSSQYILP
jgi:hypothetical protein